MMYPVNKRIDPWRFFPGYDIRDNSIGNENNNNYFINY